MKCPCNQPVIVVAVLLCITLLLAHFLGDSPVTREAGPAFMQNRQTAILLFSFIALLAIGLSFGRITTVSLGREALENIQAIE